MTARGKRTSVEEIGLLLAGGGTARGGGGGSLLVGAEELVKETHGDGSWC